MTSRSKPPDFRAMAELRYQIRRFLRFSENAARQAYAWSYAFIENAFTGTL